MTESIEISIAFTIVWTFFQGAMVLLGVRDYSLPVLLLSGAVTALLLTLTMILTYYLVILFEEIKRRIRLQKFKQRLRKYDISEGEILDKHAENLGLQREPEETDEDFRHRCIMSIFTSEFQKELKRL